MYMCGRYTRDHVTEHDSLLAQDECAQQQEHTQGLIHKRTNFSDAKKKPSCANLALKIKRSSFPSQMYQSRAKNNFLTNTSSKRVHTGKALMVKRSCVPGPMAPCSLCMRQPVFAPNKPFCGLPRCLVCIRAAGHESGVTACC